MPSPKPTRRTQPSRPAPPRRKAEHPAAKEQTRQARPQRPTTARGQGFNPGFKRR